MRGFITHEGKLRLTDFPEPTPAPGEFLMQVRAYSINPGEARLIANRPEGFRSGQDTAGVVIRPAADGSGPPVGARVVAYLDWESWAQRVAVPSDWAAALDDNVSFEDAAALPVAGLTALRALRQGGAILGRSVLVTGATGAVGELATQLAALSGAQVTAQVRTPGSDILGAHHVVTSPTGGPYHLLLDGVGGPGLIQALHHMAPGATAVLYGSREPAELSLSDFYRQAHNARIIGFISVDPVDTRGADLKILADLVAAGQLTPRIGMVRDWSQTAYALEALAKRAFRGKAILTLPR